MSKTAADVLVERLIDWGHEYGVQLAPIDFAMFAQACGGTGLSVKYPKRCGDVIEQALNTPGPVLIDCEVDPNEPPLPPKIRADQALHFAESLMRGEPNRKDIALTAFGDKVREMI